MQRVHEVLCLTEKNCWAAHEYRSRKISCFSKLSNPLHLRKGLFLKITLPMHVRRGFHVPHLQTLPSCFWLQCWQIFNTENLKWSDKLFSAAIPLLSNPFFLEMCQVSGNTEDSLLFLILDPQSYLFPEYN